MERVRTLKYAILGLLNQRSMSGYDLAAEFESALNEFWSARHSQIYPELKKLTEEGMLEYHIEISGNVLEKKVYALTDAGKEDFMRWLQKPEPLGDTPKDTFKLRCFFSNQLPIKERMDLFEEGLLQHQQRLEHLIENQKKFREVPERDSDAFSDYLVLMGAIMRETTTCEWIKKCMEMMN